MSEPNGTSRSLLNWLESRTHLTGRLQRWAQTPLPDGPRLRHAWASVVVFLLIEQLITGVLLAFYYSPSVTQSWASLAYIQDQVPYGWWVRGLHYHGTSLLVVMLVVLAIQVLIVRAYRAPRELIWWTGLAAAGVILAIARTGYLLPWDEQAYWGTQVAVGILGSVPQGHQLQAFAQAGTQFGNLTVTRFFALHTMLLPMVLIAILVVHIYLVRRHGFMKADRRFDSPSRSPNSQSYWPNQIIIDMAMIAIAATIISVMTWMEHGAHLFAPADPAAAFMARPEWYFLFLYQLLKFFEGPSSIIGTVVIPGAVTFFLLALPWIDGRTTPTRLKRWTVISTCSALLCAALGLSAMAINEDKNNPEFQEAWEEAKERANRARALAKLGVPVAGGIAVWSNDPVYRAKQLFEEHCATCHKMDEEGEDNGPDLRDYGSREWLAALIRNPQDPRFYGGTKEHDTMEAYPPSVLPEGELKALVEYIYSLRGDMEVEEQSPSEVIDKELAAKGQELWEDSAECNSCHEIEAGKDGGGAPTLTGRGSPAWVRRVIRDSSQADLFDSSAEMPKFVEELDRDEVDLLAKYVLGQLVSPLNNESTLQP